MWNRLTSTKVKIEKLEKTLSEKNTWESKYIFWNEVWASIQLKDITVTKALYLFAIKWKGDFPRQFRVVVNNRIFMPTQTPSIDFRNDLIIFHAK